jgi:hypothetical protein
MSPIPKNELSKIGITMGDPSGVGPEIIVKALKEMSPEHRSASAVIGNLDLLKRADRMLGAELVYADSLDSARNGAVPVVHVVTRDASQIRDGEITEAGGEAAYQYVVKAVELAMAGAIGVIVTAPLNKVHERIPPPVLAKLKLTLTFAVASTRKFWELVGLVKATVGGTFPGGSRTEMLTGAEAFSEPLAVTTLATIS